MSLASIRERALIDFIRWAPKGSFSRVVGFWARRPIPRSLRKPLFSAFAQRVGASLDEIERPLEDYPTLDAFFTRRLRAGARPLPADPDVVVSPCDGTIAQHGVAVVGKLIQAKGHDYRVAALLADRTVAGRFEGGTYLTIYLAPRDYHRVHFPVGGQVTGFQHIPGAFFPVNAAAVKHVAGLFTKNERLVTYLSSPVGDVAVVMVGAAGVGHITVSYDAVETHAAGKGRPGPRVRFAAPRPVKRGEELGTFHLGSTVVLLFEPGRIMLERLALGQRIRFGEPIARRITIDDQGDAAA